MSLAYTNGLTWLKNANAESTTYLAPRVKAIVISGGDATTDINTLLSYSDSGSGWGGYRNQASSNFHTALALQALKSANYPAPTVINPALAYLTSTQNPDGGWGFYPSASSGQAGADSNVYMTALASATLQQFPQTTNIATAVTKATSYLLAHQNPDGGFGTASTGSGQGSPSTVYETALAYTALVAVSGNTGVLGSAVNYLTATQSANGSWNDDPYSTALVLKALYLSENKPSPPPPPPAAGRFSGTVLDATTRQGVAGVAVVLDSNPLVNTTTDAAGTFTLPDVPPGSQKVDFSLSGYAPTAVSATSVAGSTVSLGTVAMTSSYSTGTIAGTILDATGKPLAGVAIAVSGAWSGSAVTGADGTFSFTYVTPGDVTVTATKAGYQGFSGTGTVYARTTLSISPRLSTTPPHGITGSAVGRVVSDLWGLPLFPLPGEPAVTVTMSGGITVNPDDRGYFTFQGLAPNTYQLTVGMPGFISRTFRLVIAPGVTTDLGTIRMVLSAETITLTGKVTDSATGVPIPDAEVVVAESGLTARSDFAGTYVVADIKDQDFTVRASATGYKEKTYLVSTPGRGAAWTQQMDITLTPQATTGSLTGTVNDATSNRPLSGVTLTLVGNPSVSATTDSAGTFTLNAVPKGVRQITLSSVGYAPRTLTTAITAGAVTNAGTIGLAANPLPASIQGTVWDGGANAPFAGVDIRATGTGSLQTLTAADGTYRLNDVTPGTVTVAATAGAKPAYYGARFTGELAPGGILVFSPALTTLAPASVTVGVLTDQTVYKANDTVGIAVSLRNTLAETAATSLLVRVADPAGAAVFDSSVAVNLDADGAAARNFSFVLPAAAQSGPYTVRSELYDDGGVMLGTGTTSFDLAVSQIRVTPALPAAFSAGVNTVTFNLTNTGTLPVAAGVLGVTLKDPDGQVVATASQSFALGLGETRTLSYTVSIPTLKFGTYTLSYAQSDETKAGQATGIALPNTVAIAALFDTNSHRVRETASLAVTVTNTGRFNLDGGGGIAVTAAVPDAGYGETKTFAAPPAVGSAAGSVLLYGVAIPETMTAGEHGVRITVALPSGSTQVQTAQLAIPESSLALAPVQAAYTAGGTITPTIANSGGVDTPVQYRLSLYDVRSKLIAEKSSTETAVAGASFRMMISRGERLTRISGR
jgi:hypothetical protein